MGNKKRGRASRRKGLAKKKKVQVKASLHEARYRRKDTGEDINANDTGDDGDINANDTGDNGDSVNNVNNGDGDNFEMAGIRPSGSRFHARNVVLDPIDNVASSPVLPCTGPETTLSLKSDESVNIDAIPPDMSSSFSCATTSAVTSPVTQMSHDMPFGGKGKIGKG